MLKAKVTTKKTTSSLRMPGFRSSARSASKRPRCRVAATCCDGSGSRNQAPTRLSTESAEAARPGAASEYSVSIPPTAGPKTKPRPKAAPIMPMPLARPSGVVTSAT